MTCYDIKGEKSQYDMMYDNLRIASGATACVSVSIQIFKNIKSKTSRDVSHGLIILAYISASLGAAYGFYLHKPAIYISNIVLLADYAVLHAVKFWNDSRETETII